VLVAVNASAQGADRAALATRLRALTATARSALTGIYVMAGDEWLTLTPDFGEPYSAGISLVSTDTSSALPNAEHVAAAYQDPPHAFV